MDKDMGNIDLEVQQQSENHFLHDGLVLHDENGANQEYSFFCW